MPLLRVKHQTTLTTSKKHTPKGAPKYAWWKYALLELPREYGRSEYLFNIIFSIDGLYLPRWVCPDSFLPPPVLLFRTAEIPSLVSHLFTQGPLFGNRFCAMRSVLLVLYRRGCALCVFIGRALYVNRSPVYQVQCGYIFLLF